VYNFSNVDLQIYLRLYEGPIIRGGPRRIIFSGTVIISCRIVPSPTRLWAPACNMALSTAVITDYLLPLRRCIITVPLRITSLSL